MSRNPYDLKVFHMADDLAVAIYRITRDFPPEERYALRAQMRRSAVSVPANIVEGCARESQRDYLYFVNVAVGSASETRYFVRFSLRLEFLTDKVGRPIMARYDDLIRALQGLIRSLTLPRPSPRNRTPP